MLHEFLSSHRKDLISRCRLKVSQRASPPATETELRFGVPLILDQLSAALMREERSPTSEEDSVFGTSLQTPASVESDRTAGLHGSELFRLGYTVDQVVHDYGDLCQAVTELAKERNEPVTVDEFHTFNRLLDNSIANAVAAHARHQHSSQFVDGAQALHERLGTLAEQQRVLLTTALKAFDALKVGNVGVMGATGTLLEDSLLQLRNLIDRSLPEIRLASGIVSPPGP
jgi:hypothetical protein